MVAPRKSLRAWCSLRALKLLTSLVRSSTSMAAFWPKEALSRVFKETDGASVATRLRRTARSHGPIVVHESVPTATFYAFGSHPRRVIFDQLPVNRCSFTAATQISSPDEGVLMMLLDSFPSQLRRRLGEHRRWSQSGHNKSPTLTS